jgi:GMP synthase (glutamine-hydrolysing)
MAILVVDMGSQYTHVIWRAVRDLGQDGKIVPKTVARGELDAADAVILSGGPSSVTKDDFHFLPDFIRERPGGKALLGICLGHQLIAHSLGGEVVRGKNAEYGISRVEIDKPGVLLEGVPTPFNAWVSHFDEVKRMPDGFSALAHSDTCAVEAMEAPERKLFSVQFHPEVWHTEHGEAILGNFIKRV